VSDVNKREKELTQKYRSSEKTLPLSLSPALVGSRIGRTRGRTEGIKETEKEIIS
jgi:hypothetical protein